MFKKMIALMLCLCVCAVPAFAALGVVYCDIIPSTGSNAAGRYDYAQTKTTARENSLTNKSKVMNIFAKAYFLDRNTGVTYGEKSTTSHYVLSTSATSGQVTNSWSNDAKVYTGMGVARTRYTDNSVDEHSRTGHQYTLGGRTRAASVEASGLVSTGSAGGFGSDKREAVVTLIREAYGYDLSSYNYVPVCELDTDKVTGDALTAISDIYIDIAVELKDGDHAPFGFLYQGNTAYAVVEQVDGSLNLTRYQLNPSAEAKMNSAETLMGEADIPHYCVVEVENAVVARNVLDALYE